ncbi:MAG: alkaline phosphatase family protein, partial [Peptococcaceae bacterium]|nr:alkaline phosphatase family protein [Peptococcaceae bacterium]
MPTITPPMWTTLATGAYAGTHGITDFWNPHPDKLDTLWYSFDSTHCKAEPLWNVFAEAGKKTLVFHWHGSSWPPTSDSPNLHVVDGTQPSNINIAVGTAEWGQWIEASETIVEEHIAEKEADDSGAGCVISDLEMEEELDGSQNGLDMSLKLKELTNMIMNEHEGECAGVAKPTLDEIKNTLPIKAATGWANAPEGAKEFAIPVSNGMERRPALIIPNADGVYDTVAIYKSKKSEEPIVVLDQIQVVVNDIMDTVTKGGKKVDVARQAILIELAADGSRVELWWGNAMEAANDMLFHPKSLLTQMRENVGEIRSVSMLIGETPKCANTIFAPLWESYSEWQANCMNYLMEANEYEVVFSHLHNVDIAGHTFWELEKYRPNKDFYDETLFQDVMERFYVDTDVYLGRFMHLLDKGWDIIITSDHGLVCAEEDEPAVPIGDPFGVNIKVMEELGYTVMKKDENGNSLREIDWSKTTAVAQRGIYIYINLKGRNPEGIVDPADQYELERKIIDDLYAYRWNGKRIVSIALRRKEAAHFGLDSDRCGDIVYFNEEGFNRIHGDSISTFHGYTDTSVSPIFMAAGPNIKAGYVTDRVIREVDVAPTVAVLGGVRMPAQCEGAPVYQIFEK